MAAKSNTDKAQKEHQALLRIYAKAKRYASRGNGQGGRIARMAAEGLGFSFPAQVKKKESARKQLSLF